MGEQEDQDFLEDKEEVDNDNPILDLITGSNVDDGADIMNVLSANNPKQSKPMANKQGKTNINASPI